MQKTLSASPCSRSALLLGIVALLVSCGVETPANSPPSASAATGTVPCGPTELFVRHDHAHLTLIFRGQLRDLPARVGITATTICWLHTHDSTGIIHIEAGDRRALTLGDFFWVWAQPLRTDAVDGEIVAAGESVRVSVNSAVVTTDPGTIVLGNKDDIVIQIGPPFIEVTPYQWPQGY